MGEVYRARDTRLGRDVAIKVLPVSLATDADALARFEREMKTLAALSHPHIVAIHDVGRDGEIAYAVTEFLDGETLAAMTARGPVPVRKAIEYGVQIARALGAAHERGVIHRDLKPANVIVTRDGHITVLDFGLARTAAQPGAIDAPTIADTTPGLVMGTVGYMAPEQARGLPVDSRADIFAFGCVLYELVTGRRAFQRDSTADTLSAILKEDPPPLTDGQLPIGAPLQRVVFRCLEKNPAERFQSARDLAFALEALAADPRVPASGPVAASIPRRRGRLAAAAALLLAALVTAFALGRALTPAPAGQPTMLRLTFDRGVVRNARFAPDGSTVVYSAAWDDGPLRMYVARADTLESNAVDLPAGGVLAVSDRGDLLLSLARQYHTSWTGEGTLARGRLFASGARELLEDVRDADFLPDDRLAIARRVNGRDRLEVPQGTVVFETAGYISHIRVSPDGRQVGFLEHPLYGDNRGYVAVYDGSAARRLTREYTAVEGLAWTPDGGELWFGAAIPDVPHLMINGVDPAAAPNTERTVWAVPRDLILQDIDREGRVLLTGNELSGTLAGAAGADAPDRNLHWGGYTLPGGISADGTTMLVSSMDEIEADYSVLIRRMDGSAPVKIGRGRAQALSPDGRWALSITPSSPQRVLLMPTGAGESRELEIGDLAPNVGTFISTTSVAVVGTRQGSPTALVIDLATNRGRAIELGELRNRVFGRRRYVPTHASPDGSLLAVQADDGRVLAWPVSGGPAREIAALGENETLAGWTKDPSRVFVAAWNGATARVDALDLPSGRRMAVREITVQDPAGMLMAPDLYLNGDAGSYIYGFSRMLSTLYLVTGLR